MSGRGVTSIRARVACALVLALAFAAQARAADVCRLPATFSLTVEERTLLDGGSAGLVVAGSPAPASGLRAGDVVRQANGRKTVRCEDLEAAAAEALAKGILLLVAAERDGHVMAVALRETGVAVAVGEPAPPAPPPPPPVGAPPGGPGTAAERGTVPAPAPERAPVAAPRPTTTPPPVAREVPLPPRANASAELTSKAVAAAAVLGTVDAAARSAVPLGTYERRLDEAKNAIAALRIEGDGSAGVRELIAEAIGYHETARDIRRAKAAQLEQAHVDQRGAVAQSMPYFSDSDVPRWVERYPFLSETLQQAPRATHMLVPGEAAGRWDPDRAVELLWERAAQAAARLGAWGAGK